DVADWLGQRQEACVAPLLTGYMFDDGLGARIEPDDARTATAADRAVDSVAHLRGRGRPRATAAQDRSRWSAHTDVCRTPSRTDRSSRQASTNDASLGSRTAADR